jgi:hypothetical protein
MAPNVAPFPFPIVCVWLLLYISTLPGLQVKDSSETFAHISRHSACPGIYLWKCHIVHTLPRVSSLATCLLKFLLPIEQQLLAKKCMTDQIQSANPAVLGGPWHSSQIPPAITPPE